MSDDETMIRTDILVIGSGVAGLAFALKVAPFASVALVTKKEVMDSNTTHAQGGIASVFGRMDTFALHIQDTLEAGDGLCHPEVVEQVVKNGPERIRELMDMGVKFNLSPRDADDLDLGQEGGHSRKRIVHAQDMTGLELERVLVDHLHKEPRIRLFENHVAIDLITCSTRMKRGTVTTGHEDVCLGAYVLDSQSQRVKTFAAKITLLATGDFQRGPGGIQPGRKPQGPGQIAPAVSDAGSGDHGDAEVRQKIFEDRMQVGFRSAVEKVPQHHGPHAVQHPGQAELGQHAVDAVRRFAPVLDHCDAAVETRRECSAEQMAQRRKVSPAQAPVGPPVVQHPRPIQGHGGFGAGHQSRAQGVHGGGIRLGQTGHGGAVETNHPGPLADGPQQGRNIGKSHQAFGVGRQAVEIQAGEQPHAPVAAPSADNAGHGRILKSGHQLPRTQPVIAGQIAPAPVQRIGGHRLQPEISQDRQTGSQVRLTAGAGRGDHRHPVAPFQRRGKHQW
jgi:hypothetical protein